MIQLDPHIAAAVFAAVALIILLANSWRPKQ